MVPRADPATSHIWQWYQEVYDPHAGTNGPCYLSFQEIEAFDRCYDLRMSHFEKYVLRELSVRFVKCVEEHREQRRKQQELERSLPQGIQNLRPMSDSSGIRSILMSKGGTPPLRKPAHG